MNECPHMFDLDPKLVIALRELQDLSVNDPNVDRSLIDLDNKSVARFALKVNAELQSRSFLSSKAFVVVIRRSFSSKALVQVDVGGADVDEAELRRSQAAESLLGFQSPRAGGYRDPHVLLGIQLFPKAHGQCFGNPKSDSRKLKASFYNNSHGLCDNLFIFCRTSR